MGSRVQLFADIRHDARVDGLSIRELARKHGVHRRTVRQALAAAEPPPRKKPVRTAPRLDPYKPVIDEMLRYDLTAPRKQRHTATRILTRLRDEPGTRRPPQARDIDHLPNTARVERAQLLAFCACLRRPVKSPMSPTPHACFAESCEAMSRHML